MNSRLSYNDENLSERKSSLLFELLYLANSAQKSEGRISVANDETSVTPAYVVSVYSLVFSVSLNPALNYA